MHCSFQLHCTNSKRSSGWNCYDLLILISIEGPQTTTERQVIKSPGTLSQRKMSKREFSSFDEGIYNTRILNVRSSSVRYRNSVCQKWVKENENASRISVTPTNQLIVDDDFFAQNSNVKRDHRDTSTERRAARDDRNEKYDALPDEIRFEFDRRFGELDRKQTSNMKKKRTTLEPWTSGKQRTAKRRAAVEKFNSELLVEGRNTVRRGGNLPSPIIYNIKCKNLVIKSDCSCSKQKQ